MRISFDHGQLGDRFALGVSVSWCDWHLKDLEISLDLGIWYYSMYVKLGGG